jgi:plasmid replication initiation protein
LPRRRTWRKQVRILSANKLQPLGFSILDSDRKKGTFRNNIPFSSANFTLRELKLFLMLIANARDDQSLVDSKILINKTIENMMALEAERLGDRAPKTRTKRINAFCTSLSLKRFEMPALDGCQDSFLAVQIFSMFEYRATENLILVRFNPDIRPYFFNFSKGGFVKYDFYYVNRLRSLHALHIYLLLLQHKKYGAIRVRGYNDWIPLRIVRSWFGIEEHEYPLYNDFKRKVLQQAQNDLLENADVTFDLEERRQGRKIDLLKFRIHKIPDKRPRTEINDPEVFKTYVQKEAQHGPIRFFDYRGRFIGITKYGLPYDLNNIDWKPSGKEMAEIWRFLFKQKKKVIRVLTERHLRRD